MKLGKLAKSAIQKRCDTQVYQRGQEYFHTGKVRRRVRTARGIRAEVVGTQVYTVIIDERRGDFITICTCPYGQSWGGDCKHIVATLLAWIDEPGSFSLVKDFHDALKEKSKEELAKILSEICEIYPQIAQEFLEEVGYDPRAAVQNVLGSDVVEEGSTTTELTQRLEPIAKRAEVALSRGDAELARRIYHELILGCLRLDDEYGSVEIFPDGLIYGYVQGYHEAVEADPEREQKEALILGEIAPMEKSEAAEIEGVEFSEVRKLLKKAEKKRTGGKPHR
jgi:hypothetical protein